MTTRNMIMSTCDIFLSTCKIIISLPQYALNADSNGLSANWEMLITIVCKANADVRYKLMLIYVFELCFELQM